MINPERGFAVRPVPTGVPFVLRHDSRSPRFAAKPPPDILPPEACFRMLKTASC